MSTDFTIDGYHLPLTDILVVAVPSAGTFNDWLYPLPGTFCLAQFSQPRSEAGIGRIMKWVDVLNGSAHPDGFHVGWSSANWFLTEGDNSMGKARYWECYCQYYRYRALKGLKPRGKASDIGL